MTLRNLVATSVAIATLTVAAPALAGDHGYHHGGNDSLGAGLLGFGIGAAVGSALTPSTVVVAPPPPPAYAPPPPAYPAAYGPPPWSPGWYSFCQNEYGPNFNPNTGYYLAADGGWYFCR